MVSRADLPVPTHGLVLTHLLTVRDVARSCAFYRSVFAGEVVREDHPAIVRISNSWILLNVGGGPTPDKPGVTLRPPEPGDPVSAFLNVRVADLAAFRAEASAQGASFLTPPVRWPDEIRCYLRDPDGYLIEVGEAIGI